MEGEIITKEIHPDIYDWLSKNVLYYKEYQKHFTLTIDNKINVYWNVTLFKKTTKFKYPFGYVNGIFDCYHNNNLTSLIGFPKKINNLIYLSHYKFVNNPSLKEKYNDYIDLWYELLESVSENEKWEYINNYQNKVDFFRKPIIPKEVINKYKIDFLLKK